MPLSTADKTRVAQEIADDILATAHSSRCCATRTSRRSWSTPSRTSTSSAPADSSRSTPPSPTRHTCGAPSTRSSARSGVASTRPADGGRPPARRQPRQRDHPPLALDGSKLTIRKFSEDPYTVDDLIRFGTLSRASADLLEACVRGRLNILVSGGTGAGKTTTLNVLSSFIPDDERIVTIEDAAELRLVQDHVLRLESRPPNIEGKGAVTIRDLVKNSLRMRPDRVVVGEIRDAAALDMLQAMNTGHDGSISTLHANTPRATRCPASRPWSSWPAWTCRCAPSASRWPAPSTSSSSRAGSRTAPAGSPRSPRSSAWRATS